MTKLINLYKTGLRGGEETWDEDEKKGEGGAREVAEASLKRQLCNQNKSCVR